MPHLSIVIPTWNGRRLLQECLESLAPQTYSDFDIIVVDDASTDDTVSWIKEMHEDVQIITLPENKGFAHAVNRGIETSTSDYVFLLNNDMTLASDALELLMEKADRHTMVTPLILSKDNPDVVYAAGDRQLRNGRPESIGHGALLRSFVPPTAIFGVTAGAGLYPKRLFEEIGTFDERFVAYFEDSDLNLRARMTEHTATLVTGARAYHVGSASIQTRTWWRAYQCARNHVLLVVKNYPLSLLIKCAFPIMAEVLANLLRVWSAVRCDRGTAGATGMTLRCVADMFSVLPYALGARSRIRRLRKIRGSALELLMELTGGKRDKT